MNVKEVQIDSLLPYINNARTHDATQVSQIAASIKEFGFNNPVLIDGDNGIIAGHGRVQAAKILDMETVPAIELSHMTETQKKAYILADNRLALNAGWDEELVSLELKELLDNEFDIDLTGFSVDDILNPESEGLTDEDAVPEIPEEPITRLGDIWILGNHRVMCGDSTSIDAVEKLMDGSKAELLFTSPPYSDMRDYNGEKDLSVDNLVNFIPTWKPFCEYQCVNLGIKIKDREVVEYWREYIEKAKECGYKLLAWNVWNKAQGGSIASATAMFMLTHEWIFVFGDDFKRLNRTELNQLDKYEARHGKDWDKGLKGKSIRGRDGNMSKTTSKTYAHHQLESVITQTPELGPVRKTHPAIFPVSLPEKYIEAMTRARDFVVEPFGGSGTTLIACEKTDRNCRIMELDTKYVDVIVKRWQDYTGKEAILESTNEAFNSLNKSEDAA